MYFLLSIAHLGFLMLAGLLLLGRRAGKTILISISIHEIKPVN